MATFNPTLYKYRCFDDKGYHLRLLSENELFFSSPKGFNDPFDCDIPITTGGETEDEVKAYFTQQVRNPYWIEEIKKLGITVEKFIEVSTSGYIDNPELIRKLAEEDTREKAARFGVVSLAQAWDNLLMWAHYSAYHGGFCVGFNTNKLFEELHVKYNSVKFGTFCPVHVEYPPVYPIIHLIRSSNIDVSQVFKVKSDHWIYEDEVRLLLHNGAVNPDGSLGDGTKHVFDESIIEEVVLGVKIDAKRRDEIVNILRNKSIKPKLYQARKLDKQFGFDRFEISY